MNHFFTQRNQRIDEYNYSKDASDGNHTSGNLFISPGSEGFNIESIAEAGRGTGNGDDPK